MSLVNRIDGLLEKYNSSNQYNYNSALEESKINIQFVDTKKELVKTLTEFSNSYVIINTGFVEEYVKRTNLFNNIPVYVAPIAHIREAKKIEESIRSQKNDPSLIIGFGGGVPIDLSKFVAKNLKKDLLIVPTSPAHDGHISGNSSLYENGTRQTIHSMQPKRLIIPLFLWESSGDFKKSGRGDVLSNIIALQDLSLAKIRENYVISSKYLSYALKSIKILLNEKNLHDLAKALFLSGLAMQKTSRYCSGSEHELEKILADLKLIKEKGFLHGQLAGFSSLISARVYKMYANKLPQGLFFDSREVYSELVEIFRKKGILEYALRPLKALSSNKEILIKELERASSVRPSRYTLWNEIDSKEINWNKVLEGIIK